MAEKKTHEVDEMSKLVNRMTKLKDVESLVDLGSGKAYLSQVLSSLYKIPVLAIDSRETNTQGAQLRDQKLKSKWNGLASRAAERAEGELATNRRTRMKDKKASKKKNDDDDNDKLINITKFVETGSD